MLLQDEIRKGNMISLAHGIDSSWVKWVVEVGDKGGLFITRAEDMTSLLVVPYWLHSQSVEPDPIS